MIGLYLQPPKKAPVPCCDEKSQCEALERSQPGLPLHLILNNYASYKHATVKAWPSKHPCVHL